MVAIVKTRRIWETFPAGLPALTNGRPDPTVWKPTVHDVDDGFFTVLVGGVDVTQLRGVLCEINSFSKESPIDDADAELHFPQVTYFDQLGVGDLAPFLDTANGEPRANVDIRYTDAAAVVHQLYQGFLGANNWGDDGTLTCTCVGGIHQLDLFTRAQGMDDTKYDLGTLLSNQFSHAARPSLRVAELPVVTTGILSRYKGSWESPTDYMKKLLVTAIDNATTRQWTLMLEANRTPNLRLKKDLTGAADYTISAGARGIKFNPGQELLHTPNVYYAEGETGGVPWRGARLDPTLGFYYQPMVFDTAVHTYQEDPTSGLIVSTGTVLNPNKMRIESHIDFGTGFSPAEAKPFVQRIYNRDHAPGTIATVTLEGVSPEECHAFVMEPDKVLGVRYLFGQALTKFYISKVEVNPLDHRVTLSIDTKSRDIDLLDAIKDRKDVSAKNPFAGMLIGRESALNQDSQIPWDWQNSGWLPNDLAHGNRRVNAAARFSVNGKAWLILPCFTAERVDIFRFEVHWDQAVPFHVSIYDQDPTGDPNLPANPMAAIVAGPPPTGPWTNKPEGFLIGWGQDKGRVGYYPYTEYDDSGNPTGAAPTGQFINESSFELNHDVAENDGLTANQSMHWVALWVDATGGPYTGWSYMSPGRLQA